MSEPIDIFISYKREERSYADLATEALTEVGFVTVSDINLARNEHFGDAIDKMIRKARMTIVLWTAKSAASEWVRMEARLACDLDKDPSSRNIYLGVMIEPAELPVDLRGLQMLDITKTGLNDVGLGRLVEAAREELGVPARKARAAAAGQSVTLSEEFQLYDIACQIGAPEGFERYLRAFPNGAFAADAAAQASAARRWWRRPFSRSKRAASIAFLTAGAAFAGLAVELATPNMTEPASFTATLEERNEALAAQTRAERDLARKTAEAEAMRAELETLRQAAANGAANQTDPDAEKRLEDAAAAVEAAEARTRAAMAEQTRLQAEQARLQAELAEAEARIAALTAAVQEESEAAQSLAEEVAALRTELANVERNPSQPIAPLRQTVATPESEDPATIAQAVRDISERFTTDYLDESDAVRLANAKARETAAIERVYDDLDVNGPPLLRDLLSRDLRRFDRQALIGDWRCRSIQQSGNSVVVYAYFRCRVRAARSDRLYFEKLSGSQRTSGFLHFESGGSRRLLYLGGWTVNEDPQTRYEEGGQNNEVAWAVRDGARSWQLRILKERGMEILELNR